MSKNTTNKASFDNKTREKKGKINYTDFSESKK